jgi:hypothetical protein
MSRVLESKRLGFALLKYWNCEGICFLLDVFESRYSNIHYICIQVKLRKWIFKPESSI